MPSESSSGGLPRQTEHFQPVSVPMLIVVSTLIFGQRASCLLVGFSEHLLFQFKIALLDIKPAIWRRIQVPYCTLVVLHEYIQAAFGWEN
jgi:Plasmid pRiA4b ORF-3-like protein